MAEMRDHLAGVGVVFVHGDWLGTERARSSASGVICQTETSLPFGNDAVVTGGCAVASPDFLTGKPRDAETGLDDFGARYLSSQWGRWMSADWTAGASAVPYATLTNPQSLNLYAYVGNDPVDGMDADGHARYDHGADGCAAYVSSCSTGGDYSDWASMALVDEQIYGHDLAATGGYYAVSAPNGGSYVGKTPASVITAVTMARQTNGSPDQYSHDIVLVGSKNKQDLASGPVPEPDDGGFWTEDWMPYYLKNGQLDGPLAAGCPECSTDPKIQVDLKESIGGGPYQDMGSKPGHGHDSFLTGGHGAAASTPDVNQHWYVNGKRVQLVMGVNPTTGKPTLTWETHVSLQNSGPPVYSPVGSGDQ